MSSSCSRNFMKLSRSIYISATRKVPQTQSSRYFSLIKRNTGAPLNHITKQDSIFSKVPSITACRHKTDGDKDLLGFLKDEIAFEGDNVKTVPKLNHFKMEMDGTVVSLKRNFRGEDVEVKFNCNESLNVDDGEALSEEEAPAPSEEEDVPDIVSYPSFTVTITKPSGMSLLFNCSCNTGMNDNEEAEGEQDEEPYELLRFDSVQVFNSDNTDKSKVYEAETENMDGELYSMLMNTLLERGVNGTFVNDLIDLSTSVEHRHYLNFLKSLEDFLKR